MRQYCIDELTFLERDNLENYLKRNLRPGGLEGVFWLELPSGLLGPAQIAHANCAPFYFSVILEADSVRFELLLRSSVSLHCECIAWATPEQRLFVIDFADSMLEEERIGA